jgi:ABC-2 type transport system ATP-binding protein
MELGIAAAGDGEAAIVADGFSLRGADGSGGQRFDAVSFRARHGDLVLVTGQRPACRAGLLLALTGRLGPVGGAATVAGYDVVQHPVEVRRRTGVARISGSIEPAGCDLLVDLVAGRPPAAALRPELIEFAGRGDAGPPDGEDRRGDGRHGPARRLWPIAADDQRFYRELSPVEQVLWATSWALAGDPALVVVHDADRDCSEEQAAAVWRALARVAASGVTVVASCVGMAPSQPPRSVARVVVPLPAPLSHLVDGR